MGFSGHKLRSLVVVLIGLTLVGASKPVPKQLAPSTTQDIEKLRYLAGLEDALPKIFDQPAPYGFDILSVLDQQTKVLSELQKSAKYNNRPGRELIQFTIEPGSNLRLNDAAVAEWRAMLQAKLGGLDPKKNLNSELGARVEALTVALGNGSSQGLRTGLINTLPQSERGALYKLDPESQLAALRKQLPENLALSGFKSEVYGIPASAVDSRAQALALLQKKISAESDLNSLLQLQIVLSGSPKKLNLNQASEAVAKFSPNKIIQLSNKAELEKTLGVSAKTKPWFNELDRSFKSMVNTDEAAALISKKLRITELPPTIALFRGYIGGDCSTKYSCAYPWGPDERTFMISGEDGTRKGYLSGTLVQSEGKKSFYLHTINGSKISTSETSAVFEGLNLAKEAIGAEQVILPTIKMTNTVNYPEIRTGFTAATDGKPLVPVRYGDTYARRRIDAEMSGKIDEVGTNSDGAVFESPSLPSKVNIRFEPNTISFQPKSLPKDRVLALAADFNSVGQLQIAERMISAMGRSPKEFKRLTELMKNPDHLSTEAFIDKIKQKFAPWNLTLDDDLLKKHRRWFDIGLLNASDSGSPANQARSAAILFERLETGTVRDVDLQLIQRNAQILKDDSRLWPLFKSYADASNSNLGRVGEVLGLNPAITQHVKGWIAATQDPEILRKQLSTIGNLNSPDLFPLLFDHLEDKDAKVREAAFLNIKLRLGEHREEFTPKLRALLKRGSQETRLEVAELMQYSTYYNRDRELQNEIIDLALNPPPLMKQKTLGLLSNMNMNFREGGMQTLKDLSKSSDVMIRLYVATQLNKFEEVEKTPGKFFEFDHLLNDPHEAVRNNMIESMPGSEVSGFLRRQTDLSPYTALLRKGADLRPFDPAMFPLLKQAISDPRLTGVATNALSTMKNIPADIETLVRSRMVEKDRNLKQVLTGLESVLTADDEKKIVALLYSSDAGTASAVGSWLRGTQYQFKDESLLVELAKVAKRKRLPAWSESPNVLSYLIRKAPDQKMKTKAFWDGMALVTDKRFSQPELPLWAAWGKNEVLPNFGRKELQAVLNSPRDFPFGVLMSNPAFWKDPELYQAMKLRIHNSGPNHGFGYLNYMLSPEVPVESKELQELMRVAFDHMDYKQQQDLFVSKSFASPTNRTVPARARRFALSVLIDSGSEDRTESIITFLNHFPVKSKEEVQELVETLGKGKSLGLLSRVLENQIITPEIARGLLESAPPPVMRSDAFWSLIEKVSDPHEAAFEHALSSAIAKANPNTVLRQKLTAYFNSRTVISSTGETSAPDCSGRVYELLKAL